MRAGGCTVQQALTPEAANLVKQAVTLARRRGHAQVTPLHVANTMLSSSTGLLRTACLESHSHPLQCKALELCFNVALNRLPASSSNPMLGAPHAHQFPSLSNALVAAFKRAQAHQRRGSIENQQQPLLAVKVEVEQLIISILDDPSVSRVMREAGFSSTQVKINVEKAVSSDGPACRPSINPSPAGNSNIEVGNVWNMLRSSSAPTSPTPSSNLTSGRFGILSNKPKSGAAAKLLEFEVKKEDVAKVVENLMNEKRRNSVVVGECLGSIERVVKRVMEMVDKEEVPDEVKNLQFISLPLNSFEHLSREEVEEKLGEMRCLGRGRGAVLYVGDLKWIAEYRISTSTQSKAYHDYCPIEHMVMELRRLVCCSLSGDDQNIERLCLMGVATHQTYSKCKTAHPPSLETIWELHPLIIPSHTLGLSLMSSDSSGDDQLISSGPKFSSAASLLFRGIEKQLTCCSHCSNDFHREVQSLSKAGRSASDHDFTITLSTLPSCLSRSKDDHTGTKLTANDQDYFQVRELCKKWNSFCSSFHRDHNHPIMTKSLSFSSSSCSPNCSPSFSMISSHDLHQFSSNANPFNQSSTWPLIVSAPKANVWTSASLDDHSWPSMLQTYRGQKLRHGDAHIHVLPTSNPSSASASSDTMDMEHQYPKFKEINSANLKTLCQALEEKVPWQREIVPEIASIILQCRSGMIRRRRANLKCKEPKEDTWLFFQGGDSEGKEKIGRELANLVFCSPLNFINIGLSCFSSTSKIDCPEDYRNKRLRDQKSNCSYLQRFVEELGANPHRVFFLEDIEQVDYISHLSIKSTIETGFIRSSNGNEVPLSDAIVILSCEAFDSRSRASSPIRQKSGHCSEDDTMREEADENETNPISVSIDLNICLDDCEEPSFDDNGLLQSVDGRFVLKLQE